MTYEQTIETLVKNYESEVIVGNNIVTGMDLLKGIIDGIYNWQEVAKLIA